MNFLRGHPSLGFPNLNTLNKEFISYIQLKRYPAGIVSFFHILDMYYPSLDYWGITFSPLKHMASSSCDLTTSPRSPPSHGRCGICLRCLYTPPKELSAFTEVCPTTALRGSGVCSNTTCNIPHRAIRRTGIIYPNEPTWTFQGVTHPWVSPS